MGYTAREAAKLLDLPVRRIRGYVRAGLLDPERGPRRELRFSFQDLILLRTTKELLGARIAPARVRRALEKLKAELPDGRPLTGLSIAADGRRIVVRDGRSRWNPESGQTLFDFDVSAIAPVAPLAPVAPPDDARGADEWYDLGCDLEDDSPEEARDAYRRAIELDPGHSYAHVNLGRLLHEAGELAAAEAHYRIALDVRPDDAVAAFDLGVALEDLGRTNDAIGAYQRAIANDPAHADAHFNLARLYEQSGNPAAAVRHLTAYRKLTRGKRR